MKKLGLKIMVLVASISVSLSLIISVASIISLNNLKNSSYNLFADSMGRKYDAALKNQVEIGSTLLDHFYYYEQSGKMTLEEAKKEALVAISRIRFAGDNTFFVMDESGVMLYYPLDSKLQNTNILNYQSEDGLKVFSEAIRLAKAAPTQGAYMDVNKVFKASKHSDPESARVYTFYYPNFNIVIGTYEITSSKEVNYTAFKLKVEAMAQQIITFILIISIAFLAVVVAAASLIGSRMSKPLIRVTQAATLLAQGDLTVSNTTVKGKDEIKRLTESFNNSVRGIHSMVVETRQVAAKVSEYSKAINASSGELSTATTQISVTINEIAEGVSRQADSTESIRQKAETVLEGIHQMNQEMMVVGESSRTARQVVVSGQDAIDLQKVKMDESKESTETTVQSLSHLSEISNKIRNIVGVIEDISEQTTMLALNASIEAARAGEQGKGFAVVADEIRKLAEETKSSTAEITEIIHSVNVSVDESIAAMGKASTSVLEQEKALQKTRDAFMEIVRSVDKSYQHTMSIREKTQLLTQDFESINMDIARIASVAEESAASIEEVSATTQQQSGGFHELSNGANTLKTMVDELMKHLERFTVSNS